MQSNGKMNGKPLRCETHGEGAIIEVRRSLECSFHRCSEPGCPVTFKIPLPHVLKRLAKEERKREAARQRAEAAGPYLIRMD